MVTVDHEVILKRFKAIIDAEVKFTDNKNKDRRLRKVLVGVGDQDIIDDTTPYCYIQLPTRYQFTQEGIGTQFTAFLQQLVQYNIVIVMQKKGARASFVDLNFLVDLMITTIRANPTLEDPANPGTDAKVKRLNILEVSKWNPQQGGEIEGARIVVQTQVGSAWQLILPGSITLDLIEKPLDTEGIQSDTDLEDDGNIAITKISDSGVLDVAYESDLTLDNTIRSLISTVAGAEISVTLRHGTEDRVKTVVLKELRKPVPYDNIEKSILSMNLIQ